jgi:integrase/recombinase XerC
MRIPAAVNTASNEGVKLAPRSRIRNFIRAGTDIVTVAELLGHASLDATRIYALPTDDDLDATIARLTVDR